MTVALFELETYAASDVAHFETLLRHDATTCTTIVVDGGPERAGGQDPGLESVLDIENMIGLAPASTIDVYQGPNSVAGRLRHLQQIVNQDTAHR